MQNGKKIIIAFFLVIVLFLYGCSKINNMVYIFKGGELVGLSFDIKTPAKSVKIDGVECESAEPFTHWVCPLDELKENVKITVEAK